MEVVYRCSKCKQEFFNNHDCINHEFVCLDLREQLTNQVNEMLGRLTEHYKVQFTNCLIEVQTEKNDEFNQSWNRSEIQFDCKLPNGNSFYYRKCDICQIDVNKMYDEIVEEYIYPRLPTTYEGEIWYDNSDCYDPWNIGDISVSVVAQRLSGRKVRIQVVE